MKPYKYIYVVAPRHCSSGGVELAHQLVDYLRNKKQLAYIVYEETDGYISQDKTITKEYSSYNIAVSTQIEDKDENVLVLPEMMFEDILKYKNIQIGCWWMSVDNRYSACYFWDTFRRTKSLSYKITLLKRRFIEKKYKFKNTDKLLKEQDYRITHFYQSHYAQHHLYNLGFSKILPLSDYINSQLTKRNRSEKKENIILYNPKKGLDYTKEIIKTLPNYKFVALEGFERRILNLYFDKSKLYIDFGNFPGKDRLPREAALHDCCVITGKNGAAFYYEDLPLEDKYKFDTNATNIINIANQIEYIINNYEEAIKDFAYYKNEILKEKDRFFSEIDNAFITERL